VAIGLLLIAGYVLTLLLLMEHESFDTWGALLLLPVLLLVTVPALLRQAEREGDPTVFRVLLLALFIKLGGALARYFLAYALYGGTADATQYHKWGVELSSRFWSGDFRTGLESLSETDFIRFITGVVYSVIGPSKLAGFLFFSWMGFLGLFFFYRAFVLAVPGGRRRSYAYLLFFLPSLVFWPSSIGKEAWMMLGIGLTCFGIARMLRGEIGAAVFPMLLGLWATGVVRPHIAGMLGLAVVAAVLLRRPSPGLRQLAPAVKVASLVVVAVLAAFLVVRTDRFLQRAGIETTGGVGSTLEGVSERTSGGGSEFAPSIVNSPARAPIALATVLYRPFLFEAHNTQALWAAIEATVLMAITALRWRSIVAAVRGMRRTPYLAFALAYIGMFIVGYSSISNFGLLARQRVQLYPLFLVLLCLTPSDVREPADAHGT
jgi:hypothetical protein